VIQVQQERTVNNFALIGAAGYVAPRHMQAIANTGNQLVAAVDPHDSVGILDRYFPDCRFFTEFERFDRHLEKLRRKGPEHRVDWVAICSPNYLHDAHCRVAMRVGAHALCEKPLTINPWNLDQLIEMSEEYGRQVYTVLQLRVHPALVALRQRILSEPGRRYQVQLSYVTRRGAWYLYSWKGDESRSGGLAMNIGVHFFDLLLWLFGDVHSSVVHERSDTRVGGALMLDRADVSWFLSIDGNDRPAAVIEAGKPAFRSMTMDGEEIEFSDVFGDLHTDIYRATLAGEGFTVADAAPSIRLVYDIRTAALQPGADGRHPLLNQ
jgi:UDP-N-acetyl-2-amino-2-deoxyglucuronate dehydrogenase